MNSPKTKRLRVFAGPNGSGKSTLAENLKGKYSIGVFVNADEIEKELKLQNYLLLDNYNLRSDTETLRQYLNEYGMSPLVLKDKDLYLSFSVDNNKIYYSGDLNSYIAADLAGFIRKQLMIAGESFSFESVFSHSSKLEIMEEAKKLGYKVYFYFVTTEHPDINVSRVNIRVKKNGHSVPEEKIRKRYYNSLDLMLDAVKLSWRAYLFDNSGVHYELVAEVESGKKVETHVDTIPNWFVKYLFQK